MATTIEETAVTAETDRFRRRVEADRGDETTSFVDYSTLGASGRYNAQTRMLEINSDTDADVDAEIQLQNLVAENLDDSDFIASGNM